MHNEFCHLKVIFVMFKWYKLFHYKEILSIYWMALIFLKCPILKFFLSFGMQKSRSHGGKRKNGNIKHKNCTEKRINTSLKYHSIALNNHGRHDLLSFLNSLPISVLRNLELEVNKLYDRAYKLYKAALLTRCYVQHFLSPYVDSEVNNKRHFIEIPFITKGIECIDLHSIFKDNSVISSIPNYFNNSEAPSICYKYNKQIRPTLFNLNKIVTDINVDSNTFDS